jgi:hypothetical protein
MKKFDFLQTGADIILAITDAAFRMVDFLAKQVYLHLREAPTTTTHKT